MSITAQELDRYRTDYRDDRLSFEGHRALYDRIANEHPDQTYASPELVGQFLDMCQPHIIVELGGWDGTLAAWMSDRNFSRWTNYEIAQVPQVCSDHRYRFRVEGAWRWDRLIWGDAFIASHVLEHLTEDHLTLVIQRLHCRYAYVDVPLGAGTDWMGDTSTHVLRDSLAEFDARWTNAGWQIIREVHREHARVPSHARFLYRA